MSDFEDDDFLTGNDADSILNALGQQKADSETDVMALIDKLEVAFQRETITPEEVDALTQIIPSEYFKMDEVGTDFDMKNELGMQLRMVNALRSKVITGTGQLKKEVSISEAKSVLDSCRQTGEVIRKNMESVVNLNRIQALEAAVLATVNGHPEEFKREFLASLEKQLAFYCRD